MTRANDICMDINDIILNFYPNGEYSLNDKHFDEILSRFIDDEFGDQLILDLTEDSDYPAKFKLVLDKTRNNNHVFLIFYDYKCVEFLVLSRSYINLSDRYFKTDLYIPKYLS